VQHEDERAAIIDDDRDQARDYWMGEIVQSNEVDGEVDGMILAGLLNGTGESPKKHALTHSPSMA